MVEGVHRRKHEKILLGYLIPHSTRKMEHLPHQLKQHSSSNAANNVAMSGDTVDDQNTVCFLFFLSLPKEVANLGFLL